MKQGCFATATWSYQKNRISPGEKLLSRRNSCVDKQSRTSRGLQTWSQRAKLPCHVSTMMIKATTMVPSISMVSYRNNTTKIRVIFGVPIPLPSSSHIYRGWSPINQDAYHFHAVSKAAGYFDGFRVQGSGFRVQSSRFRVQGSGFRVQGSLRVQG
jgi:hypothetical protein